MKIQFRDVYRVYSGKPGCGCGCNGKYYTPSYYTVFAGKDRGYEIDEEEVRPDMVKRIVEIVEKAPSDKVEVQNGIISYETNKRCYWVYLTDPTNRNKEVRP